MKKPEETPELLFERIRRRRGGLVDAGPAVASAESPALGSRSEVPGSTEVRGRDAAVGGSGVAGNPGSPSHAFPRSATMRLLLRHPELAIGLGLPAIGLLLGSSKARRLLGEALRLGIRPEVQQAVRFTSALRQRGRRSASPPRTPDTEADPADKKKPR